MREEQIIKSKRIHRRTGKTFYFATKLLPERIRHATYVLYGFFRIADEVVDDEDPAPPEDQESELERIRAEAKGEVEASDPVLDAFHDLKEEYGIPDSYVDAFIDSMKEDIAKGRYATYAELRDYMYGSAAMVGLMMTAVMEPKEHEKAKPHAVALGEAFQMTNFIRDVREDIVERDRVYIPMETLERHGVSYDQIENLEFSSGFGASIEDELHRTEDLYKKGVAGIKYLPKDCQFAVLLAAVLYADHHRLIRDLNFDVLSETPSLSTSRKLYLVARTYREWVKTRDPKATFRSITTIPTEGTEQVSKSRTSGSCVTRRLVSSIIAISPF
ncbi:MAG: phytoene/squalene synthase family protein [Halobacteria archaeon]|nr:phytoene/squalene synthase family protein [Halobacteria archaeon]